MERAPAQSGKPAIRLRNLKKTFGGSVAALAGVDLDVPAGLFGLLGPNGSGKTTLMRTLATLLRPDSGSATVFDIDVLERPKEIRGVLGYLPQDFGVYPGVSARSLLEHFALLKGLTIAKSRRTEVDRLLERVNLERDADRALASFSGGMRQRFGVAQALLGAPRLVIVDEPTAGLDPLERNRFHHLLAEIADDAVVLLSTHIVEDVAQTCPNVAILLKGRVIRQGAPKDLGVALQGRLWEGIVTRTAFRELSERHSVLRSRPSGGEVWLAIVAKHAPAEGFTPRVPELEDAYHACILEAE